MTGNRFILSIILVTIISMAVRAEMVTRTRMVVDTVAAMKMIKEKIDNKNLPNKNKINISEKKIVDLQNSLRNMESKKNDYDNLFSLIEPKIKDYPLSVKLYDVLAEELPNIPADSIYKYAKKGDYKKAVNDKMWREKLADLCQKTIDNVLKDAQKGKFGSGLVKSCFLYRLAQLNDEIDAKSKDIKHEVDTRDLISEKLISIPSNFTAELWLTEMPNRDVPTKIITEYRERRDDTDMNFQEAIDSYVNDVELNEIERVAGKFDGLIKDELYCFSLTKPYSQIYDYTELISKNGTVPTLIIKFPGEIILGEVGGPCISMEAVNDIWDSSCVKKDGIICSFSPDEEAAIMGYRDIYSFFFDGYNWVKSKPLNPIYLTFEECGEVVKSKSNKNLYLKSPLSDEKIKVVAVTRDDLGVPKSSFDDGLLVIKDEWENNIEYENVDFEKIMRESNKWGIGNDALVVYYIDRKDNKRKFDKYALMEGPECSEWVKREEGIYNAYQGTYNIKEVEYDESVYY